jgi:predicted  nucleic acid-binding Zn-ribbon protein
MATVAELKAKIAAIDAEIIPLTAELEAAKVKTNQANAAMTAVTSQPGRATLSQKIAAQKALSADPTNVSLQDTLTRLSEQFKEVSAIQPDAIKLLN